MSQPNINQPYDVARAQRLRRWGIYVLVLAVTAVGISRISFDVDILRLLPQRLPEVRGLVGFIEHFSRPDELILAVDGEDPEEVAEATRSLATALRDRPDLASLVIDQSPWENDPGGLAELIAYVLINQDPARLAELAADLAPGQSQARLEEMIEAMTFGLSPEQAVLSSYDAFGLIPAAFGADGSSGGLGFGSSEFGSEDGKMRLLYLWSVEGLEREDYLNLVEWTAAVRTVVEDWQSATRLDWDVRVRLTGEPAIMGEVSQGMEWDIRRSALATLTFIAAIFWIWYRRVRPLLLLLAMLCIIFLVTLGFAGLLIQNLTVMTVGFASILIGLSVDYGILIYQGSLLHPGDPIAVRRSHWRGILCASATTALAFAALLASSLPSISELGTLVAIGIAVGASVMLFPFSRQMARITTHWQKKNRTPVLGSAWPLRPAPARVLGITTGLAVVGAGAILWLQGLPELDKTEEAMRPRHSEAYEALDDIIAAMWGVDPAGSFVVRGANGKEVQARLAGLAAKLDQKVENGELHSFMLPRAFVPMGPDQQANLANTAPAIWQESDRLLRELDETGFGPEASLLLEGVFDSWRTWAEAPADALILPQSPAAHWILDRLLDTSPDGTIWISGNYVAQPHSNLLDLQDENILLADWDQTMIAILGQIPREIRRILGVLVLAVLGMLWYTFRRWQEIAWVALTVGFSLTLLLGTMSLLGWSWNFFNLAALLLCLGAGLDYSIHMLLGLRRHGETGPVLRETGQALLVCALSSIAGFGSLSWASNLGLASLGRVCALALALNACVAIFLLPFLWSRVQIKRGDGKTGNGPEKIDSSLA